MGYRDEWFKHNKPDSKGKYKCVNCKKKFEKRDIDIDHKIPKRKGGTDQLWNLQAMCKWCNRSKGANQSLSDTTSSVIGATLNGDLGKLVKDVTKQKTKDALGIKYKRK
ncbi:MAG: hypothetical protein BEN19_01665 [Epulopiscium sp. Nuni2H_MBin003]|nr:MAG: hypothetical protein BEN19_01665 [Epulopiscium sp. Nuni2H_MBin003]